MKELSEKELFETAPVPKAVAALAIPTILSQVVTMIYNLADTFGFIREEATAQLGTVFLRIACLAVPITSVNALIIYTLQAMGKGVPAAILTTCRQGVLNIPLLLLMNRWVGLYGMIWTQLMVETIMLPATLGMYGVTWRRLKGSR